MKILWKNEGRTMNLLENVADDISFARLRSEMRYFVLIA